MLPRSLTRRRLLRSLAVLPLLVACGRKAKLAALPAERWGAPKTHRYGQREFWVRDPDGNLVELCHYA